MYRPPPITATATAAGIVGAPESKAYGGQGCLIYSLFMLVYL